MSFIILILIIILLYAVLTKYSSMHKVILMTVFVLSMTTAFLIYGINVFKGSDTFVLLNTEMNLTVFVYACIIWFAADILVIFKIVKNYRKYIEVNS
ncbi:MAG TPA: hypothetical protein PKG60_08360 [Spirochaetota bacterium]|nr:hypothetical protein [Spirochaetota bacterium]HPS86199.1 hypothetical protein [Spirochaetota bacterium]